MNRLNDVALLRCFATISLVAWHSYCSYICWGLASSPLNEFYTNLFYFITPDANMPLFTFISGYLFSYLLLKGKYLHFRQFANNKVNRLLYPYLILGFAINMTQIGRQNPIELLLGAPNHLWYCLMLFYCFMACWLIEKWKPRLNILAMFLSFLLVILAGGRNLVPTPLGIWMPCYYYGYFYFGFLFFRHRDKAFLLIRKWFPIIVIFYIVSCILKQYTLKLTLLISCISFLLIVMRLANSSRGNWLSEKYNNSVEVVGKYSFGVYVFHQWIIWNVTRYPRMSPFMSEHYILFPLLLFITVFFVSMLLTHFSLKTRIGRFLLL